MTATGTAINDGVTEGMLCRLGCAEEFPVKKPGPLVREKERFVEALGAVLRPAGAAAGPVS